MTTLMRRRNAVGALVLALIILAPDDSKAQESPSVRKVVSRVTPPYPSLARPMHIQGSVKLEAVVAPNGTVKSVGTKGGHPLLVQSAQNAIVQWKWEPAPHETREVVEIRFNPE
jgi:TonB family protein